MTSSLDPLPLAHALTDLSGHFVTVDNQFCSLLRRERSDIVGRTILEVTAEPFRPSSEDKLNELRSSGRPFVIQKEYLCGDGTLQPVENSISLLVDETSGGYLAASVRALDQSPGALFADAIGIARALLAEQRDRAGLERPYKDRDWRLLLAAYLAEAEGLVVWTDELSAAAGGDARANLLRIWELVKDGALILEGEPVSLDRVSVRVSARDAEGIERHLLASAAR